MSHQLVITPADLSAIERALRHLSQASVEVQNSVGALQQHQVQLSDRLEGLISTFTEFVRTDARHKEVQLAETRVVRVRQELEQRFGHYAEVRRRATGILQAFDEKLVSAATVQHTTEDMLMKAPGYWLAPALVALAAWARDDRGLAERALGESIRRDDYKTSLFLSLVTRRLGRHEAAASWFDRYLAHQDPTGVDREFVVLLDSVANGLFGPGMLQVAVRTIDAWLLDLAGRSNFVPDQEARWASSLAALTPSIGEQEFTTLRRFSPNWPDLGQSLASARLHAQITAFFRKIFEGPLHASPRLEKDLDQILDSLVTNFDDQELPLRSQERLLQLIIEKAGDKAAAQLLFDAEKKNFEEKVSFTELLTNAAMSPELSKASLGTRRLAVALSRSWIVAAHDQLTTRSRATVPAKFELKIGDWTGATVDGSDEIALVGQLSAHLDELERKALAAIKQPAGAYILLATALGLTLWGAANATVGLPLVLLAGAAAYTISAVASRRGHVKKARKALSEQRESGNQILRASLAEAVDLVGERSKEDAKAERTREVLLALSPQEVSATRPGAARAVLG
jgi:hypothetical protein